MADSKEQSAPEWMLQLENKRKKQHRLAHDIGAGAPCFVCEDKCPGLDLHFWRKLCRNCKCKKEDHDVKDDEGYEQFDILLGSGSRRGKKGGVLKINIPDEAQQVVERTKEGSQGVSFDWLPPNVSEDVAVEYMQQLPAGKLPISGSDGALYRRQQLEKQVPLHDLDAKHCHNLSLEEIKLLTEYLENLKNNVVGQGCVGKVPLVHESLQAARGSSSSSSSSTPLGRLLASQSADSIRPLPPMPPAYNSMPRPFHPSVSVSATDQDNMPPSLMATTHPSYTGLKIPSKFLPEWRLPENRMALSEVASNLQELSLSSQCETPAQFVHEGTVSQLPQSESTVLHPATFSSNLDTPQHMAAKGAVGQKGLQDGPASAAAGDPMLALTVQKSLAESFTVPGQGALYSKPLVGKGPAKSSSQEQAVLSAGLPLKGMVESAYPAGQKTLHAQPLESKAAAERKPTSATEYLRHMLGAGQESAVPASTEATSPLSSDGPLVLSAHPSAIAHSSYVEQRVSPSVSVPLGRNLTEGNWPSQPEPVPSLPHYSVGAHSGQESGAVHIPPRPLELPLHHSVEAVTSEQQHRAVPLPLDSVLTSTFHPHSVAQTSSVGTDALPKSAQVMQQSSPVMGAATAGSTGPLVTEPVLATESQLHLDCHECGLAVRPGEVAVFADRAGDSSAWHPACFVCAACKELLVDLMYFYHKGRVYCGRHFADLLGIPRCFACDELIFVKEYTVAEGKAFHVRHFCCYECDDPLAGKQYVAVDEQPVCLTCYERKFGKKCHSCKCKIGAGEQRVGWQHLSWHVQGNCFCCYVCARSLLGGRFVVKQDQPFCSKECVQTGLQKLAGIA